jgi:hypothetical protein
MVWTPGLSGASQMVSTSASGASRAVTTMPPLSILAYLSMSQPAD